MRKNWLNGKTIVISGASSGIGRGIAQSLIEKYGCKVIGIGRNEQKMLSLLEELGDKSSLFLYKLFDVGSLENWQGFAKELKENNTQIDVLINNAGYLPPFKKFEKFNVQEVEDVMNVNYFSVVYGISCLLDLLKQSKTPAIINVSSMAALTPLAGITGYSASKGALKNFTESLQQDYKKQIYIGSIYPGFTRTDIFRMQNSKSESKLINMVSTSCEKMVKKCVKGISKRKKRMVYGFDCKTMNLFYKFFPVKSLSIFTSVMKKSNIEMFKDIFE